MLKKSLMWASMSLLALLPIGYIALQMLEGTTVGIEKAAIAQVRAIALQITAQNSQPAVSRAARSESSSRLLDDCAEEEKRLAALIETLHEAMGADPELREGFSKFWNYSAYYLAKGEIADLGDEFWSELAAFVEASRVITNEAKDFLSSANPNCGYLQRMRSPDQWDRSRIVGLLTTDQALAVHQRDFDLAMNNLRISVSLAYTARGFGFPSKIERQHATLIFEALKAETVRDETWEKLLSVLWRYRERSFMIHYLHHYPHVPFGATVQETSFIKRGVRAVIRDIQEPALNRDAAHFVPLLEELAELASVPYHTAEPELQRMIREYRLVPHDRHSYSNESGARASVVNRIHVVFPRNATVQAQIDVLSLVIALERTRRASGFYPDAIEAVSEALGAPVPLNPINGTPYRYELTDEGFLLGFELDLPVLLTMLVQSSRALWVESKNGELAAGNGEN